MGNTLKTYTVNQPQPDDAENEPEAAVRSPEKASEHYDVVLQPAKSPAPARVLAHRNSPATSPVTLHDIQAKLDAAEKRRQEAERQKVEKAAAAEGTPIPVKDLEERQQAEREERHRAALEREAEVERRRLAKLEESKAKAESHAGSSKEVAEKKRKAAEERHQAALDHEASVERRRQANLEESKAKVETHVAEKAQQRKQSADATGNTEGEGDEKEKAEENPA